MTVRTCPQCRRNKVTFTMPPGPGSIIRCQPCASRDEDRRARYAAEAERQAACRAEEARVQLVADVVARDNRDLVTRALSEARDRWRSNGHQPDCRGCSLGIPIGQTADVWSADRQVGDERRLGRITHTREGTRSADTPSRGPQRRSALFPDETRG